MPDLLLELFSEEIPARMQAKAAEDLRKMVTDRLVDAGLVYEGARAFATPRRLTLFVQGVPARQPDLKEERKGPRVGAPEGAIAGFLKAAGLASISEASIQKDPKKGDFYIALTEKPGRPALDVIGEFLQLVLRTFPWPKSMRWGEQSAKGGSLEWVRPLHSILATFGPETEQPEIVHVAVGGIVSGDTTFGHRFLAPGAITARHFADYAARLEKAKVVLDPARRKEIILNDAKNLAFAQGYELVEDEGLLNEVAGLVEWPVVLMGTFDEAFLKIPDEVIRATIRNNQKCFVLRDPKSGRLANRFILTANTEASDAGRAIIAGNERVIRARLSDAKFFYETDLKIRLEDRLPKFKDIIFHEKLGTQAERIERIERLAVELAKVLRPRFSPGQLLSDEDLSAGVDYEAKSARAARLCKADLLTEVVGEFPETQGLMGKYYALAQGEDASVAAACEEHYKPAGPSDRVPTDPVSIAVALADKIDTLVGFWAIDEKPTGSKDPYALRRAALGVIRLVVDNKIRISLERVIRYALAGFAPHFGLKYLGVQKAALEDRLVDTVTFVAANNAPVISSMTNFDNLIRLDNLDALGELHRNEEGYEVLILSDSAKLRIRKATDVVRSVAAELGLSTELSIPSRDAVEDLAGELTSFVLGQLTFATDRLKVQLREQGARHDLVDAVLAQQGEGQDDLLLIVRRVEALGKFLSTDDGKSLLAGYKRATNILRIEEKKDGKTYHGKPDPHLYLQPEERALAAAIHAVKEEAAKAVEREDFEGAMAVIAKLRSDVDAFFEKVTVNVAISDHRENRLKLLNEIREATGAVADFSKIEG